MGASETPSPPALSACVNAPQQSPPTSCWGRGQRDRAKGRGHAFVHFRLSEAPAVTNSPRITLWPESAPGPCRDALSAPALASRPRGPKAEASTGREPRGAPSPGARRRASFGHGRSATATGRQPPCRTRRMTAARSRRLLTSPCGWSTHTLAKWASSVQPPRAQLTPTRWLLRPPARPHPTPRSTKPLACQGRPQRVDGPASPQKPPGTDRSVAAQGRKCLVASVGVVVAQALAGVKRGRRVQDVWRLTPDGGADLLLERVPGAGTIYAFVAVRHCPHSLCWP